MIGLLATAYYVPANLISENFLFDTLSALSLMIAFYYSLSGIACVIYYRRELTKSVRNFVFIGVAPLIGAVILAFLFVKACIDYADPDNAYGGEFLGVGVPLVIGVFFLGLGVIFALLWKASGHEQHFGRKPFEAVQEPVGDEHPAGLRRVRRVRRGRWKWPSTSPVAGVNRCTSPSPRSRRDEWARSSAATSTHSRPWDANWSTRRSRRRTAAGVEAVAHVAAERPVDLLLRLGDELDAIVIVVGSYGESPLRGAVVGSTPHKLLHLSRRPVLAVPTEYPAGRRPAAATSRSSPETSSRRR